ncbi:MAG: M48 family metallopeptidase, partial [bacterium]|nr:M48 family metallopeptidase [bacterium]
MKKLQTRLFVLLIATLMLQFCSLVPLTGRRQLSLVSDADMFSMSFVQYDEFLKENKLSANSAQTNLVKGVGRRIQNGVTAYFSQNNLSQDLNGFAWEFNLIESKEVNAWCMPGGKVVVYSGILPITKNENGLAVVIGHEIAHAVAKHSNERMSQALLAQLGGQTLAAALQQKPQQTQQLWMGLFGVGVQLGADPALQSSSGGRGRSPRINFHGNCRIRPQRRRRVLTTHVSERGSQTAGVPEHTPHRQESDSENQIRDSRGDEVL